MHQERMLCHVIDFIHVTFTEAIIFLKKMVYGSYIAHAVQSISLRILYQ